jgi:hypothetical protein
MKSLITGIALAATFATALINTTPALALPNMPKLEITPMPNDLSSPRAESIFMWRQTPPRLLWHGLDRGRVQRVIEERAR